MTIKFINLKFVNLDSIDGFPQLNFIGDFIDDDDNETYQLNISYRPTVTADDDYSQIHHEIDGHHHTDDIDTIENSQYFDDDAIAFFIETARSHGFGA